MYVLVVVFCYVVCECSYGVGGYEVVGVVIQCLCGQWVWFGIVGCLCFGLVEIVGGLYE